MSNVPGRKPIIVTDEIYNKLDQMKVVKEIPFYEIIDELIQAHEHLCNIEKKHKCLRIKPLDINHPPAFVQTPIPAQSSPKEPHDDKIVLIDFYTDNCSPCKALKPIIDEIEIEFKDKVIFKRINPNDAAQLAEKYNIKAVPTIIIEKNDELVKRIDGLPTGIKGKLTKILKSC